MPSDFLSHLEEFRRRLITALLAFAAAMVLCTFFSHAILDFLAAPLQQAGGATLIFQKPYEAFLTHMKVAAFAGLILASPVLFWELWLFVSPGLYAHEKAWIVPLVAASVLLFLGGLAFGYWAVLPWGLRFLLSFRTETLAPMLSIGAYFSFLIGMLTAFGILFDFPVLVIGLAKLGVVRSQALAGQRRLVVVGIFLAAAILTPSPDPFSQLLLALPLLVLFEISLAIVRFMERRGPVRPVDTPGL